MDRCILDYNIVIAKAESTESAELSDKELSLMNAHLCRQYHGLKVYNCYGNCIGFIYNKGFDKEKGVECPGLKIFPEYYGQYGKQPQIKSSGDYYPFGCEIKNWVFIHKRIYNFGEFEFYID